MRVLSPQYCSTHSLLTLMLGLIALPPSPTTPTPIHTPPPPIVSVAWLIIHCHVRISRLYRYPCKPLADMADVFLIASRIVTPPHTVVEVETGLQRLVSPASLPHQLRILFPAADNRNKQIDEHVTGARDAIDSRHNNNHNPSHTHQREHRSDSVLALFISVFMRPPHRLNINE